MLEIRNVENRECEVHVAEMPVTFIQMTPARSTRIFRLGYA